MKINAGKVRINALVAIITFFITFVLSIVFLILSVEAKKTGNTTDVIRLGILNIAVIVVYIYFYIISTIDAGKLENKTPFTLLVIGLFIGFIGIIGLFLLRSNLKIIEDSKQSYNDIKRLTITAIFAALAIIIGYIEIPWFPPLVFLKLDFSEVVILISLVTLGFGRTTVVIVLRSVIRWLISSNNTDIPFPFFGELLAITASLVIIASATLAFKVTKTNQTPLFLSDRKDREIKEISILKQFIHLLIVVLIFTTFMTLLNAFITFPAMLSAGQYYFAPIAFKEGFDKAFFASFETYLSIMIIGVAPFNIVKGVLTMIAFSILHGRIAELEV